MKVNGEHHPLAAPLSLRAYLIQSGFVPERVAVERNGAIVPRAQFADVLLSNDDKLEIVAFMGGG